MEYRFIEYSAELGPYLRKLRKEKKLTLKELSKLSGVSYSQISKIEQNIHNPPIETIEKLARSLSAEMDEVLSKKGYIKREKMMTIDTETRYTIFAQYQQTCQLCGVSAPEAKIIFEHILPLKEGGSLTEENATLLCEDCQRSRKAFLQKNKIEDDYLYKKFGKQKSS